MDDGLVLTNARAYDYCKAVLILVVVDDGLVLKVLIKNRRTILCLNPCCSGRWSRTAIIKALRELNFVLILVVVDNGIVLTF